jgi:hypothetical protein
MTTKQENKLSMFMVARDYLAKNSAITATLPNFDDFNTRLVDGIIQIQNICELQEFDKRGLAVSKMKYKNKLIELAFDVSRKLVAYALFINNDKLFKEADYSESDLVKSADTILYNRCRVIYDRAVEFTAELAAYGVTHAMLTDLQTVLGNYNAAIPRPRIGISEKKQATEQLVVWIENVDQALLQIDVLVDVVRLSEPLFHSGYLTARMIVDNGTRKLALRGLVIDALTQLPVKGAQIIFTPIEQSMQPGIITGPVRKRTADKGGFFIRSMYQGSYDAVVIKPGYKTTTFVVHVTEGIPGFFKAPLQPLT